jgi:mannose-1-phosphate guanylyltransferase
MKQHFQQEHPTKWFNYEPTEYKSAIRFGATHLKTVILAGGFATRLRPLSCTRPKILFPIVNKPLLQWTFERLARNNAKEVILAVFYQTEVHIKQSRIPRTGLHLAYSHDPINKPLGTAGSIKKAEKRIGHDSPFLVLNGDIFADVNYSEILKQHEEKGCLATIALHEVSDPTRYGAAKLSKDGRITGFIEKPRRGEAPSNLINAGVYVLDPKVFDYIPDGRAVSIEREVFPRLAEENELDGHVFDGLWTDIGKPEDYMELNKMMLRDSGSEMMSSSESSIDVKKPAAFGKDVSIGQDSTIGPYAILGEKVIVGKNVHISNSIILNAAAVSDSAIIDGAIIGEGVHIGKNCQLNKGCIIGDHARIKDRVILPAKTHVCPADEIVENPNESS